MKRIVALILCVATLFAFSVMFTGCGQEQETYLQYGKKYTYRYDEKTEAKEIHYRDTFVFNEDKTGQYDEYEKKEDFEYDGKYSYVRSFTIKFKWRWADMEKSAIYIFETERIYNDEHDDYKDASISNLPFIIGEEFVAISGGARFVLEDSDVFNAENALNEN